MSTKRWREVTRKSPCSKCGKDRWCSESSDGLALACRWVNDGTAQTRLDKHGAEFHLYLRGGLVGTPAPDVESEVPSADAATLHSTYSYLLALLDLSTAHRENLRCRGLNDDEIDLQGYRSFPGENEKEIAERLASAISPEFRERIPGLYCETIRKVKVWRLAGCRGILIPVRDVEGKIRALKLRREARDRGPRYVYLSSRKHGGASSGSHTHVPRFRGQASSLIRLTEGELKADIATALSGIRTVSIPGVSNWRMALPTLKALEAQTVRLAFDSDARTNPHVARALVQTADALKESGFNMEVESWD
jgi:DNA primase